MDKDEAVKKLQAFLKENHLQLKLTPIKVRMVEDGSAIIDQPIIIVTPEPKAEEKKVN
jgi:Iap family predicted aminopeptidase